MANLAVLLEPFPIRNTLGAYSWIGERLCRMLLDDCAEPVAASDVRIICDATVMMHLAGLLPAARPYLLQPDAPVQERFSALIADWHTVGLKTWTAIQLGSADHEALYEALLRDIQRRYPVQVLAYWGTNETLRTVAGRLGIAMVWAELGPMRPPFAAQFCLDQDGVNGLAASRRVAALVEEAEGGALPAAALDVQVGDGTAYEAALALPGLAAGPEFAELMRFTRGRRQVVLLAMQLADDANIVAFGNGWTCHAMVQAALDTLAGPDTVFILRQHPAEPNAYHTYAAGAAVLDLVATRADVRVCRDAGPDGYLACLSVATEVVCINSSVGFEAALLGKRVRVLGEASYMPAGPGTPMAAPPMRLRDEAIEALLADHYIPEARFWTLACWQAAAAVARPDSWDGITAPQLPTAETKRLGTMQDAGPGLLAVDGIGTLELQAQIGLGTVDQIRMEQEGEQRWLRVAGWGVEGLAGGMFAGVLVTTGAHTEWSAQPHQRADVANHFRCAVKLASGYAVRVQLADMPADRPSVLRVYGVTAAGRCHRLGRDWMFDPGRDVAEERAEA